MTALTGAETIALVCVVGAVIVAASGHDGWGWGWLLLFVAVLVF